MPPPHLFLENFPLNYQALPLVHILVGFQKPTSVSRSASSVWTLVLRDVLATCIRVSLSISRDTLHSSKTCMYITDIRFQYKLSTEKNNSQQNVKVQCNLIPLVPLPLPSQILP